MPRVTIFLHVASKRAVNSRLGQDVVAHGAGNVERSSVQYISTL